MKKYERPENLSSFVVLWIRDAMTASASALTASSVISGILLFLGLSEKNVGVYLAIIPVANLVLSLLFSSAASATKHTVGAYSILCLCCSALTAAFLLVFRIPTSSAAFFPVLLCVGAVLSAVAAIRMIFDYQIPCRVMDLKFYSLYISVGGIVSGIAGIATSSLFAFCIKKLEFMTVSRFAYIIAALHRCCLSGKSRDELREYVDCVEKTDSRLVNITEEGLAELLLSFISKTSVSVITIAQMTDILK